MKIILKPIIVLIISMVAVLGVGWYVVENTNYFNMEKINKYAVSKNIKADIKNASSKIEKEYYKSDEYKRLVEREVSSMLERSRGISGAVYLKQMLKGMYILYSAIAFIIGLILTGYINDLRSIGRTTSEEEI